MPPIKKDNPFAEVNWDEVNSGSFTSDQLALFKSARTAADAPEGQEVDPLRQAKDFYAMKWTAEILVDQKFLAEMPPVLRAPSPFQPNAKASSIPPLDPPTALDFKGLASPPPVAKPLEPPPQRPSGLVKFHERTLGSKTKVAIMVIIAKAESLRDRAIAYEVMNSLEEALRQMSATYEAIAEGLMMMKKAGSFEGAQDLRIRLADIMMWTMFFRKEVTAKMLAPILADHSHYDRLDEEVKNQSRRVSSVLNDEDKIRHRELVRETGAHGSWALEAMKLVYGLDADPDQAAMQMVEAATHSMHLIHFLANRSLYALALKELDYVKRFFLKALELVKENTLVWQRFALIHDDCKSAADFSKNVFQRASDGLEVSHQLHRELKDRWHQTVVSQSFPSVTPETEEFRDPFFPDILMARAPHDDEFYTEAEKNLFGERVHFALAPKSDFQSVIARAKEAHALMNHGLEGHFYLALALDQWNWSHFLNFEPTTRDLSKESAIRFLEAACDALSRMAEEDPFYDYAAKIPQLKELIGSWRTKRAEAIMLATAAETAATEEALPVSGSLRIRSDSKTKVSDHRGTRDLVAALIEDLLELEPQVVRKELKAVERSGRFIPFMVGLEWKHLGFEEDVIGRVKKQADKLFKEFKLYFGQVTHPLAGWRRVTEFLKEQGFKAEEDKNTGMPHFASFMASKKDGGMQLIILTYLLGASVELKARLVKRVTGEGLGGVEAYLIIDDPDSSSRSFIYDPVSALKKPEAYKAGIAPKAASVSLVTEAWLTSWLTTWGSIFSSMAVFERARKMTTLGLGLNPTGFLERLAHANTLLNDGVLGSFDSGPSLSLEKAKKIYEQLIQDVPSFLQSHRVLGDIALLNRDMQEARRHYAKSHTQDPLLYKSLAVFSLLTGDMPGFNRYASIATRAGLSMADIHEMAANCYVSRNDMGRAFTQVHQALKINPGMMTARYLKAFILFRQEDYGPSLQEVSSILESNPEHAHALILFQKAKEASRGNPVPADLPEKREPPAVSAADDFEQEPSAPLAQGLKTPDSGNNGEPTARNGFVISDRGLKSIHAVQLSPKSQSLQTPQARVKAFLKSHHRMDLLSRYEHLSVAKRNAVLRSLTRAVEWRSVREAERVLENAFTQRFGGQQIMGGFSPFLARNQSVFRSVLTR